MKTITIGVQGMHCASCESLVGEVLMELGGVESVQVTRSLGTVKVVYDDNRITVEALKAAIEKEGYTVSV